MTDSNTHGEMIIGEGFSAFIDGVPDTCDHRWDGASVFQTASGKMIYWHTFRRWAGYTDSFRSQLIIEHQEIEDDPVVMQATTCSLCNKICSPPIF